MPLRPRHYGRRQRAPGAGAASARDLLDFACHHGFRRDEVIAILDWLP